MSHSQQRNEAVRDMPNPVVTVCATELSCSATKAWHEIGDFGSAGRYLNVPSELISGEGDVGSVRTIGDTVVEVMVQKGPLSYTYTQVTGPMAAYSYHGSVAVEPSGTSTSRLVYTILFDRSKMDDEQHAAAVARIRSRFKGMVDEMKKSAEA